MHGINQHWLMCMKNTHKTPKHIHPLCMILISSNLFSFSRRSVQKKKNVLLKHIRQNPNLHKSVWRGFFFLHLHMNIHVIYIYIRYVAICHYTVAWMLDFWLMPFIGCQSDACGLHSILYKVTFMCFFSQFELELKIICASVQRK